MNTEFFFEFRKKLDFIGPKGIRIRKKWVFFQMLTYSLPRPTFTTPNGWCPVLCSKTSYICRQTNITRIDCHTKTGNTWTMNVLKLEKNMNFRANGVSLRKKCVVKVDLYVLPRSTAASPEGWHPVLYRKTSYICRKTIITRIDCHIENGISWTLNFFLNLEKKLDFHKTQWLMPGLMQ